MYPYYHSSWMGVGAGLGIFSILLIVLFWILVIVFVFRLIRWVAGGSRWHREKWRRWQEMQGHSSALGLLNERYVKGEINKEEYEQKKKDITS